MQVRLGFDVLSRPGSLGYAVFRSFAKHFRRTRDRKQCPSGACVMRLMTQVKLLFTVVCLVALSPIAFGQAVYGSIYGTVADSTGAVVPNATVTVSDVAKGTSITVQSNTSGE